MLSTYYLDESFIVFIVCEIICIHYLYYLYYLYGCVQVSTFFIDAIDLGDVQKLVVEKSPGSHWHLSQMTVKKGVFAPSEDVFHYDRFVTLHLSLTVSEFSF